MRHTRSEELGKQTKATALSSACSQAGGGEGPVNSEVEQMRCESTEEQALILPGVERSQRTVFTRQTLVQGCNIFHE